MERHYKINGMHFSLHKILWRYRKDAQLQRGLLLCDCTPPPLNMLILTETQLPDSPEDALMMLQRSFGVCSFHRTEEGHYIADSTAAQ